MTALILWGSLILAGVFGLFVGGPQERGSILLIAVGIALVAAVNGVQNGVRRYTRKRRRIYVCQNCDYITGSAWGAEAHHRRYRHELEG